MNKTLRPGWLIFIGILVFIIPIWLPANLGAISWAGVIFVVVGCIYMVMDLAKSKK